MILLAILAVIFSLQMNAQPPGDQPPPPGRGPGQGRGFQMTEEDVERRVDNLAEILEMTDEQHDKVLKLELEHLTRMQVEREKHMGDREAMRSSMMQLRDEKDKKYEEILTGEQIVKLRQIQAERRARMQQQREQRDGSGSGDRPSRGRDRD